MFKKKTFLNLKVFIKWLTFVIPVHSTLMSDTSENMNCADWSKKHIFNTNERHYKNITPFVIKFNKYDELNRNCSTIDTRNAHILYFYPNKELLIHNDMDLRFLLRLFNFDANQKLLVFQRVKGFNQKFNRSSVKRYLYYFGINFYSVNFDFYINGTRLLTKDLCALKNFNKKLTNYFGSMVKIIFDGYYTNVVCPYVFMNTQLGEISFNGISNSLIYKNRLEFLDLNETTNLNTSSIYYALFYFDYEHVTHKAVNKLIFRGINVLILQGIIYDIQVDFFYSFKNVRCVTLSNENLKSFLHVGLKWLNYLNKNIRVNLSSLDKSAQIMSHSVILEIFGTQKIFTKPYNFPNEDLCLFKDFPHQRLVYPAIYLEGPNFKCSCTVIWLIQYSHIYLNRDYSYYDNDVLLIYNMFRNFTAKNCLMSHDLKTKIKSCEFKRRFEACNFNTHSFNIDYDYVNGNRLLKWIEFIIEVFLKPTLCLIGMMTNSLTIILLNKVLKKKHCNKILYNHMLVNALFNLAFCIVSSFSLMNVCIFPKTSFCSSIYKERFAQYFKIYVINFLGEALRFCCNFSYFTFAFSRIYATSSVDFIKTNIMKLFEKIRLKLCFFFVFLLGLLLNLFKLFEYKITEPFSTTDIKFPFNGYDILYCENGLFSEKSFIFRCKLFPILNLVNSVLNNVVYVFLSAIIDILLINFSNRNLKRKKLLTHDKEKLDEALRLKEKINKMIVTNGLLYFVSHFPQFFLALVLLAYKKKLSAFCTYSFLCNEFLEVTQTFNLLSIAFQFFIYKKFDKNIRECFYELELKLCVKIKG